MNGESNDGYFVNSLARGLAVLSAFTPERPELTILEIATHTGLHHSTVFRFAHTLEQLGYLSRNEESKKYRQTIKVVTLGLAARAGQDLRMAAQPHLEELSQRTRKTAKLAVLDGAEIVFLATATVPDAMLLRTPVGHRLPVYCTALGKALVAFQPPERWDSILRMIDFRPRTPMTISDPVRFKDELQATRARGYAITNQEYVPGLGSVAAPVLNHLGEAVAAINLSELVISPETDQRRPELIAELLECAARISRAISHQPIPARPHSQQPSGGGPS